MALMFAPAADARFRFPSANLTDGPAAAPGPIGREDLGVEPFGEGQAEAIAEGQARALPPERRSTFGVSGGDLLDRQPIADEHGLGELPVCARGLDLRPSSGMRVSVPPLPTALVASTSRKPLRGYDSRGWILSAIAAPFAPAASPRQTPSQSIRPMPQPFLTSATRAPRSGAWFGFLAGLAAAALLWLALGGERQGTNPVEARTALLTKADVQQLAWKAGPSPLAGQVRGDVVWSPAEQAGYLTFEGLPPLGPEQRFQLWIVDGERPGSAPVDGGLFDIRAGTGSTVVPIDPKLPVRKAAAFVVTVEGKDGAVVSKQEHVVAIAGL